VNEDEFADFLDNGRYPPGRDDESTRDTAVRFRDLLADDAEWAEASPTGVDDLLAAVEAEAGGRLSNGGRTPRSRAPSRARSPRLVLVAAAAGIVVVAGVVGSLVSSADDDTCAAVTTTSSCGPGCRSTVTRRSRSRCRRKAEASSRRGVPSCRATSDSCPFRS
jgi:hypothetical protein